MAGDWPARLAVAVLVLALDDLKGCSRWSPKATRARARVRQDARAFLLAAERTPDLAFWLHCLPRRIPVAAVRAVARRRLRRT